MSRDNQEKHSPIEPDSSIEVAKAGDAWMNYVQDFEKLRQFLKNLGPVTGLWIAQQIDIFAGKYPSKPDPDTPLNDEIAENILNQIYKHLDSLPYAGGYPSDYKETLAKHLAEYLYPTHLQPVKESAMGWLKKEGYPDVMPMTLDNLEIILNRYVAQLKSTTKPLK